MAVAGVTAGREAEQAKQLTVQEARRHARAAPRVCRPSANLPSPHSLVAPAKLLTAPV